MNRGANGGTGGGGGLSGPGGLGGGGYGGGGGYAQGYRQYEVEGEKVMQKIRDSLAKRGNRTLRSMGKAFKIMDNGVGDRKIDPAEFATGMREFGAVLSQAEVNVHKFVIDQVVLQYLDRDGNGTIDYDEFLVAVRGRPNGKRQTSIDLCFAKMDRDGSGFIERNDLLTVYDFTKHPKYNNGKNVEQIQGEFLENFGDVNKDGKISKQEWDDYYSTVSASVDNDDHFCMILEMAWKLKK